MNARRDVFLVTVIGRQGHVFEVKDQVANLAEELVPGDVPVGTVTTWNIRICVNQGYSLELVTPLDCWWVNGVADELGVI